MAWGCPGTVPSQDHSAGEEGEEQGQCLCQAAPCPGRAGSQACAPCEPRGSVTLILALSASPLAGLPLPLSEIPHCLCQILTGRAALPVRAASAGLGSAGCSVEPLPGSRLFTLQPPSPNRSVRSTSLRPVNISLSAVGCCSLDDHRDAAEWLQSQAGSQEPTGAACCLSPPSPKAFPGRLRAERGCVPRRARQGGTRSVCRDPARPQARLNPRYCPGRARDGPGTGSAPPGLEPGQSPPRLGREKPLNQGHLPGDWRLWEPHEALSCQGRDSSHPGS